MIGNLVAYKFTSAVRKCKQKQKCKVYQPIDYKISDTTVFQPDVLIVRKDIIKRFLDFPPSLVIEILSPSSELIDRYIKYPVYEQQGIPYYLIILLENETVEVYELQNNEYKLRIKERKFTFTFLLDDCETAVDFGEIWS